MAETSDRGSIRSRCKAISALFPYVVWRERDGQRAMLDAFLRVAGVHRGGYMWYHIESSVSTLLHEESRGSLKPAIILASPHFPWDRFTNREYLVKQWVVAVSTLSYADEFSQSVVDALLQIASVGTLRPYIPADMWLWLNKRPLLPPVCTGRYLGSSQDLVQKVRGLGDIETFTSYLFLVWSEWDYLKGEGFREMLTSIRKDLEEIQMWRHREDLLRRLNRVLGQLDLGLGHLRQHYPGFDEGDIQLRKDQYGTLKEVLCEMDRKVNNDLISEPPVEIGHPVHTNSHGQAKGVGRCPCVRFLPYVFSCMSGSFPTILLVIKNRCPP